MRNIKYQMQMLSRSELLHDGFSTLSRKQYMYFQSRGQITSKASSGKKNILRLLTGFVPFFEQKLQGLFKDFQGHISHFSRTPFSAKKRFESMSFLVLPQHEQFYPEGLSYQVLENLGWIKLAPKFKDFPAPTAIFKDFQGLELFISNFKDFQGVSRCVRTLCRHR